MIKNKKTLIALLILSACKPQDLSKNATPPPAANDPIDNNSNHNENNNNDGSQAADPHPCIPKDLYEVRHVQPPTGSQVLFWEYFNHNIATPAFCKIEDVRADTTHYARKVMLCDVLPQGGGDSYDANYVADELMASFRAQGFQPRATKNEVGDIIVVMGKPTAGSAFYPNGYGYYRVTLYFTDDSQIPNRECE